MKKLVFHIFLFSIVSCGVKKDLHKNELINNQIIVHSKIAFWNINEKDVSLLINDTLVYSNKEMKMFNDHYINAVLFFELNGQLYAYCNSNRLVSKNIKLTTRVGKYERQDSLFLENTKSIVISYIEDKNEGLILLQEFNYLVQ